MTKAPVPTALMLEDDHGDRLRVARRGRQGTVHVSIGQGGSSCHIDLTPDKARALRDYLDTLAGDGPVAEPVEVSVEAEAHDLIYGDRQDEYGHPRESFTRIAALWTVLLGDKLEDGVWVSPEDVARLMVALKLVRDVNLPKRDNRVDAIGYVIALDRLETGR